MIVDAYSHCGKTKYEPVEQVLAMSEQVGISRTVLCQHLDEYDNTYLADVLRRYPERFAAVCLIDPRSPEAFSQLERRHMDDKFRGVRVLTDWMAEYSRLWIAAMNLGLNLVMYAPSGIKSGVKDILNVARGCPSSKIVISHLGNPKVVDGQLVEGYDLMALADAANIYVQLSGQAMFCEYPYHALNKFIQDIVRTFSPSRVLWGSNFPVGGNSRAISNDLALVRAGNWGLDQRGIESITERTATDVWFSQPSS